MALRSPQSVENTRIDGAIPHLVRLFFFPFAQRARWAAAIFLRAALDMGLRTWGMRDPLDFAPAPRHFPGPPTRRLAAPFLRARAVFPCSVRIRNREILRPN